jgi:hypothetical protein
MQLDRTHVVIRVRSLSEIGDLAMAMLRRYPMAMLVGFAGGALPWALANAALLYWIPIGEASYGLEDEEALGEVWRYLIWMALLVMLQTPAAGVLATIFLGQAVFEQRPTWKAVLSEAKRQFRGWFRVLAIRRLAVPTMIVLAFRIGQPASVFWDAFLPIIIFLALITIRGSRPFVPEILLLEQCPLKATSPSAITMSLRSRILHTPMAGDLGGRFLSVGLIFAGLTLCVLYTLMAIRGVLFLKWNFLDLVVLLFLYPLALWTVAGVSVLVRLLGYLDTRIRLEGWEVELAVRAEAMRQFGEEMASSDRGVVAAAKSDGDSDRAATTRRGVEAARATSVADGVL